MGSVLINLVMWNAWRIVIGVAFLFFYNEKKQLTEVVSDNGNRLRYQYNDNGRLVLVTDHTGRKVALVYEERKLVKVTVPSGSVYSYQYSENGRIKRTCKCKRSACSMQ